MKFGLGANDGPKTTWYKFGYSHFFASTDTLHIPSRIIILFFLCKHRNKIQSDVFENILRNVITRNGGWGGLRGKFFQSIISRRAWSKKYLGVHPLEICFFFAYIYWNIAFHSRSPKQLSALAKSMYIGEVSIYPSMHRFMMHMRKISSRISM